MEKIYRILLGIFLVCLIPILLVLSYWSCRYSYYGTIKDSTWKHFVIFLLTSVLVYEGDKWLNAQNQEKQEKICRYTLLATGMTTFILGCVYVLKNPYYPEGDQINATAFAVKQHLLIFQIPVWRADGQIHTVLFRRFQHSQQVFQNSLVALHLSFDGT